MAERSLFWDNGVGDGGPYDNDELRILFKVFGAALGDNEGVVGGFLNSIRPTSPGANQVRSDIGAAIVDGTLYNADASVTHTMSAPAGGATGKRLVLRKSWAARTVRSAVIASADGTGALPALAQIDGTTWEIPLASFVHNIDGTITSFADVREFTRPAGFEVIHTNAGAVLASGVVADLEVLADMELSGWSMLPDQSGTLQYDLQVDSYANHPPAVGDSIIGSGTKPNLSTQAKNQGTVEGYGTRKLTKGQILRIVLDASPAPANVTRNTVVLKGWRA